MIIIMILSAKFAQTSRHCSKWETFTNRYLSHFERIRALRNRVFASLSVGRKAEDKGGCNAVNVDGAVNVDRQPDEMKCLHVRVTTSHT